MKINQINKLIKKYLEKDLSGYHIHNDLIYKIDSSFFLRGYDFESTGNGEFDLAVWYFVQPLFVKSDFIHYLFGKRLTYREKTNIFSTKNLEWWDASVAHLEESFLSISDSMLKNNEQQIDTITPEFFYNKYKTEVKTNVRIYEAVAYTTVLMGDLELQNKLLEGLINYCNKEIKSENDTLEIQIKTDATLLLNTTTQKERLRILKTWSNETISYLKLPNVPMFEI